MMPNLSRLVTFSHAVQNVTGVTLSRLVTPPFKGRDNVTTREFGFGECSEVETLAMQWLLKLLETTP